LQSPPYPPHPNTPVHLQCCSFSSPIPALSPFSKRDPFPFESSRRSFEPPPPCFCTPLFLLTFLPFQSLCFQLLTFNERTPEFFLSHEYDSVLRVSLSPSSSAVANEYLLCEASVKETGLQPSRLVSATSPFHLLPFPFFLQNLPVAPYLKPL